MRTGLTCVFSHRMTRSGPCATPREARRAYGAALRRAAQPEPRAPQGRARTADHTTADHTTADHATADHMVSNHTTADHATAERVRSFGTRMGGSWNDHPDGPVCGRGARAVGRCGRGSSGRARVVCRGRLPEAGRGASYVVHRSVLRGARAPWIPRCGTGRGLRRTGRSAHAPRARQATSSGTATGGRSGESRSRSRKRTTVAAAVRCVTSLSTSCRVPARLTSSAPHSAL